MEEEFKVVPNSREYYELENACIEAEENGEGSFIYNGEELDTLYTRFVLARRYVLVKQREEEELNLIKNESQINRDEW